MEIDIELQEAFDFAKEQRGFTLTDFKTTGQYRLPYNNQGNIVLAQRQTSRSTEQRAQKQTRAYGQSTFGKGVKEFNGERILFSTNGAGQLKSIQRTFPGCSTLPFNLHIVCYATCIGWKGEREA